MGRSIFCGTICLICSLYFFFEDITTVFDSLVRAMYSDAR